MIYSTETTLGEHGDKIDPGARAEVERAVEDLKRAVAGDNIDEIKRLTETLTHTSDTLAQSMSQQAGPANAQQAGPGNAGP